MKLEPSFKLKSIEEFLSLTSELIVEITVAALWALGPTLEGARTTKA